MKRRSSDKVFVFVDARGSERERERERERQTDRQTDRFNV